MVEETNAIGTAWLRTDLLPREVRPGIQKELLHYLDLRVRDGAVDLTEDHEREAILARTQQVLDAIWARSVRAAADEPNPVTTGLFIQALNEMIDAWGSRDAALSRHVPETVLFLLYGTFLMSGCVVGFTAGLSGHRTSFVTYIMTGLIVILVFIIVDLDRPRRGLIQVDQHQLIALRESLRMAD